MLYNKINILIGIGFPASLVYLYFKFCKSKKDKIEDNNFSDFSIKSRQTLIEIQVPLDCVRLIIGPQGSNIKEIQRRTNTRINFKESNKDNIQSKNNGNFSENESASPGDRILVIRGATKNVQQAEFEIKKMILECPINLTEEYYVPDYACGRIIGRNGTTIKEISNVSSCKIKLHDRAGKNSESSNNISNLVSSANQTNKLITITGSFERIAFAKELIISKIKEEDEFREKRASKNKRT